jgi:predicted acetyltransferase
MEWKPRLIEPAELDVVADLSATVFGVGPVASDSYRRLVTSVAEADRTFVVDDGPTIAGTGAHFTFDLTLPGGAALPIGAVTEVGVLPTHRRRGVLTAIMGALLDQCVERGEPLAGLTASEAGIYRRYGYGVATRCHTTLIHTPRVAELAGTPDPGRFRLVAPGEAAELLPVVWEQRWRRTPGELSRKPTWWDMLALDPEDDRDGGSARFVVVHEDAGRAPDGFAAYRLKEGAAPGDYFELQVLDFAAADDRAEHLVLRYLTDVDLVRRVRWVGAPVDLPLPWRLVDRRAVEVVREFDHLWLRPLDVARCLSARRYAAEGGGVIEVVDPRRPEVGGRFALDAGPDGADCARASVEPDVVLGVADLGSLLLGGVGWSTLQRAGTVEERTPGVVDRLDALFRPARAPHCATDF